MSEEERDRLEIIKGFVIALIVALIMKAFYCSFLPTAFVAVIIFLYYAIPTCFKIK